MLYSFTFYSDLLYVITVIYLFISGSNIFCYNRLVHVSVLSCEHSCTMTQHCKAFQCFIVIAMKTGGNNADLSSPRPTRPDPTRPDPTRPDPTRPDPTRPDPTRPDPTRPAPPRPDPTRPDPTRPDPTRPDPTRPAPGKRVRK